VKSHPDILHSPDLKFFKDYLESLNATIPKKHVVDPVEEVFVEEEPEPPKQSKPHDHPKKEPAQPEKKPDPEPVVEEEEEEADPLLMAPDTDTLEMGDSNKEVPEDDDDSSYSLMSEGRKAIREGKLSTAIEKLTEGIILNPKGSVLFSTRAEALLELKKPNAAIKDCNRALELNPDSGKALKIRGKARRFLGIYGEAFYDLQQGNLLDYDETTDKMIKEIKERAEIHIQKKRKIDEKKPIGLTQT